MKSIKKQCIIYFYPRQTIPGEIMCVFVCVCVCVCVRERERERERDSGAISYTAFMPCL